MDEYTIVYRGREIRPIFCYNLPEAKSKALYWYQKMCKDKHKSRAELKVKTPTGSVVTV